MPAQADSRADEALRPADDRWMVEFRRVRKAFGDLVVLDDLDLQVAPGEKLSIIGPSGSGKTTILRVIMTLERIDAGTIEVGGEHLYHEQVGAQLKEASEKHIRKVRSRIGMVFQHFNLFPHMSSIENIMLAPIKVHGKSRDEARELGMELLAKVGLAEHANHTPGQLSGGQKQRVAIARALAAEPSIMLFDEVTSALDPELVHEVLAVMRDLAAGGMTMMIVTHEMRFAREVGTRLVFMHQGRVHEEGPPKELFAAPKTPELRQFVGSAH